MMRCVWTCVSCSGSSDTSRAPTASRTKEARNRAARSSAVAGWAYCCSTDPLELGSSSWKSDTTGLAIVTRAPAEHPESQVFQGRRLVRVFVAFRVHSAPMSPLHLFCCARNHCTDVPVTDTANRHNKQNGMLTRCCLDCRTAGTPGS